MEEGEENIKSIFEYLSLSVKEVTEEDMNKEAFLSIINNIIAIEQRRDFMEIELGIDLTAYEQKFFEVIHALFKMSFNSDQLGIIDTFLYGLPEEDLDWDGTVSLFISGEAEPETVKLRTPDQLWEVVKRFEIKKRRRR